MFIDPTRSHPATVPSKDSVLIHAPALNLMAQRGEVTALKRAIAQGADVNEAKDDWFPLMMAVAVNQTKAVEVLLRHGARADQADLNGMTSLALAVQEGHVGPLGVLLKHGANVNKANENGVTPLLYAAQVGHSETVAVLLEFSADVNAFRKESKVTPLHAAVRCGSTAVVASLLDAKANPDVLDASMESPLLAAIRGSPPLPSSSTTKHRHHVKTFNVATKPPNGALKEALVAILIAGGANVNFFEGPETPLGACIRCGGVRLAERLLQAGSDVTVANAEGATALLIAACISNKKQLELARLLVEHGADVNAADKNGVTALHAAVHYGRLQLVELLLSKGAKVDAEVTGDIATDLLMLPKGFTSLRIATSNLERSKDDFFFSTEEKSSEEDVYVQIADVLLQSEALEQQDAASLKTIEDVETWFRALSWSESKTTESVLTRLKERSVDVEQFFKLEEAELGAFLASEEDDTASSELWLRKIKRHSSIQTDRLERLGCVAEEGCLDDAEARDTMGGHIRKAVASYNLATTTAAVLDMTSLDSAVAVAEVEKARFESHRQRQLDLKCKSLGQRWAALQRTLISLSMSSPITQPKPTIESCFTASSPAQFRLQHLRVRAAAARPILYGIATLLCDTVNKAATPAAAGLSGTTLVLPFATDPVCCVNAQQRCRLLVPHQPTLAFEAAGLRNEAEVTDVLKARIEVEDPYVAAVLAALLAKKAANSEFPIKILKCDSEALVVNLKCAVLYPRDAEEHYRLIMANTTVHHREDASAFVLEMAGVELMVAEMEICFATLVAIQAFEEPYCAILQAADPKKHLLSNRLVFLDPDSWVPTTPPAVVAYERQLRSSSNDAEVLEEKLSEAVDSLRQSNRQEKQSKEKIVLINKELAAVHDEVSAVRAELTQAREINERCQEENQKLRALLLNSSNGSTHHHDDDDDDPTKLAAVRPMDIKPVLPHIAHAPTKQKPQQTPLPKRNRTTSPKSPTSAQE